MIIGTSYEQMRIRSRSSQGAHIVGQSGGWSVMVKYGMIEWPFAAQRSRQVRLFHKLETLVAYLKGMGIARFDVDAANYDPEAATATRLPDRAEVLMRVNETAAYDAWFREQVQASLDDPRLSWSDDKARARSSARKAALLLPER